MTTKNSKIAKILSSNNKISDDLYSASTSDLTDGPSTTPIEGQLLKYNTVTSKWDVSDSSTGISNLTSGVVEVDYIIFNELSAQNSTDESQLYYYNDKYYLKFNSSAEVNDKIKTFSINGAAPKKPTITSVTTSDNTDSVVVSLSANTHLVKDPITQWSVRLSPGNITQIGSSSPITFTNLTRGQQYTFYAKATNSFGESLESPESSAITPKGKPVSKVNDLTYEIDLDQLLLDGTFKLNFTFTPLLGDTNTGGYPVTYDFYLYYNNQLQLKTEQVSTSFSVTVPYETNFVAFLRQNNTAGYLDTDNISVIATLSESELRTPTNVTALYDLSYEVTGNKYSASQIGEFTFTQPISDKTNSATAYGIIIEVFPENGNRYEVEYTSDDPVNFEQYETGKYRARVTGLTNGIRYKFRAKTSQVPGYYCENWSSYTDWTTPQSNIPKIGDEFGGGIYYANSIDSVNSKYFRLIVAKKTEGDAFYLSYNNVSGFPTPSTWNGYHTDGYGYYGNYDKFDGRNNLWSTTNLYNTTQTGNILEFVDYMNDNSVGNQTDWYLPAVAELNMYYVNRYHLPSGERPYSLETIPILQNYYDETDDIFAHKNPYVTRSDYNANMWGTTTDVGSYAWLLNQSQYPCNIIMGTEQEPSSWGYVSGGWYNDNFPNAYQNINGVYTSFGSKFPTIPYMSSTEDTRTSYYWQYDPNNLLLKVNSIAGFFTQTWPGATPSGLVYYTGWNDESTNGGVIQDYLLRYYDSTTTNHYIKCSKKLSGGFYSYNSNNITDTSNIFASAICIRRVEIT